MRFSTTFSMLLFPKIVSNTIFSTVFTASFPTDLTPDFKKGKICVSNKGFGQDLNLCRRLFPRPEPN